MCGDEVVIPATLRIKPPVKTREGYRITEHVKQGLLVSTHIRETYLSIVSWALRLTCFRAVWGLSSVDDWLPKSDEPQLSSSWEESQWDQAVIFVLFAGHFCHWRELRELLPVIWDFDSCWVNISALRHCCLYRYQYSKINNNNNTPGFTYWVLCHNVEYILSFKPYRK